jgi:regulator of protease activity HflC (stomatin/prohibitin superfamily)
MRAEQDAQQMEYVVQREKQEAERKLIEAQGIRDANQKLSEGLTPAVLRYKAIEALSALANSPNAKLVVTSTSDPLTLGALQSLVEDQPGPGPGRGPPAVDLPGESPAPAPSGRR